MLTLEHIEQGVKRYCFLARHKRRPEESERDYQVRISAVHPLTTDEELELFKALGLMVFIGVARMYAFDKKSIIHFLMIEHHQYKEYLGLYQKYITQAVRLSDPDPLTKPGKVLQRTRDVVYHINRKCG